MDDSDSATPLTDRAIARLRALAEGNGLPPEGITLTTGDEKLYTLEGIMTFAPICETQGTRYPGPVRGKNRQMSMNFETLRNDAEQRQKSFQSGTEWVKPVTEEVRKLPGEGWALHDAKVLLPERSVTLAAIEPCITCKGQKMVTCGQCQGHGTQTCFHCTGTRQEFCYTCHGTGQNPEFPNQPCVMCHALRYVACRQCKGLGHTPCRTCGGKRGTLCTGCGGVGQTTEEITLQFAAVTHFQLRAGELPLVMRRGLERLGLANLGKGHADIEIITPKNENEEEAVDDRIANAAAQKPPGSTLHYRARLPFADLRVDFAGNKVTIGVFGKRAVLLEVPPFLDQFLKPWRDKLELAAKGRGPVDDAIEGRALRDALALELQGKGDIKEFKKLYPVGLSTEAAKDILRDMRLIIKRRTLLARAIAAVICGALSGGLFAACFFTPMPARLVQGLKWGGHLLDFAPLAIAAGFGWSLLNTATYYVLRRQFPGRKITMKQPAGKIEYTMLVGIAILWFVVLGLSHARPAWLPPLPFLHF